MVIERLALASSIVITMGTIGCFKLVDLIHKLVVAGIPLVGHTVVVAVDMDYINHSFVAVDLKGDSKAIVNISLR